MEPTIEELQARWISTRSAYLRAEFAYNAARAREQEAEAALLATEDAWQQAQRELGAALQRQAEAEAGPPPASC